MTTKVLSVLSIFEMLGDEYVLLKKSNDFPAFLQGSDIDILVVDVLSASEKIQKYLVRILDGKEEFLRVKEGSGHIKLDVIRNDKLWLRLDLIDGFDFFTQFSIQDALKTKLFLSREKIHFDELDIFVPSHEFDLLIRYFEYLEWFERRPDKIKHLDYILENSSDEQRAQLINNLHRYVSLHHSTWQGSVPPKTNSIQQNMKQIMSLVFDILKISWKGLKSRILI